LPARSEMCIRDRLSAMTMEKLTVTGADSGTSLRLEKPTLAEQLKMRLAVALAKRSQKWQ